MKRTTTHNVIMRFLLFSAISLLTLPTFSQQDPIFSQYMFNPFVVNPAYAGSRDAVSTVLLYRAQWVGLNGAPTTGSLSMHAPVKATQMAWGVNIMSDQIGPTSTTFVQGTYAYRLRLLGGRLSMAVRGGYFSSVYDKSTLDFDDESDNKNEGGAVRAGVPNFDFGLYYHTPVFFLGFASSHLYQPSFKFSDQTSLNGGTNNFEINMQPHLVLSSGFVFNVNDGLKFKPSVYAKVMQNAPLNVDVNLSLLIKKKVWLGISYSSDGSVAGMIELNATDFIRIGYAYDIWMTQEINRMSTHEIFIGYDFRFSKKTTESPKYL